MRKIFVSIFFITSNFCFGQTERLRGNWISEENEMISFIENLDKKHTLTSKTFNDNFFLEIYSDTLSFQSRYYTSADDYEKMIIDRFDLKVLKNNDSLLIVIPVSDFSKKFFGSENSITFKNQEYIFDKSFEFEKLEFHASTCFGSCPQINLIIDSEGFIKANNTYYSDFNGNEVDEEKSGNFKGKLDNSYLMELEDLLIKSKIGTIKINENTLCCDGVTKTIIVYYSNKRVYIETMFEPRILGELISFLYDLSSKITLKRVEDIFEFEK
jgi:hypothetical protein